MTLEFLQEFVGVMLQMYVAYVIGGLIALVVYLLLFHD